MIFILTLWSSHGLSQDKAMLFHPDKNGVVFSSDATRYDFTHRSYFQIADQRFYYKRFRLKESLLRLSSERPTDSEYNYHRIVAFEWPEPITNRGEIIFVSPVGGHKLYSIPINADTREAWLTTPKRIQGSLQHIFGDNKLEYIRKEIKPEDVQFGIYPVPEKLKAIMGRSFRFCVFNEEDSSRIRLCSPYYRLNSAGQFSYTPQRRPRPAEFTMNGRRVRPRGRLKFKDGEIDFTAKLPNGFQLEIKGRSLGSQISQVVVDGPDLEVIGFGDKPKSAHTYEDQYRLFERVGWLDTISPKKFYWKMLVDREDPVIPVLTTGMDFFGQRFLSQQFPNKEDVIFLDNPPRSTYDSTLILTGRCQKKCQIEPKDKEDRIQINGNRFTWFANMETLNESQQKELLVQGDGKKWRAQHEIFLASSTEISGRFSVLATLDATVSVLAEASAQHWFEDLLGWQNSLLSKQRWGVSVRHFQTLTDIVIATGFQPLSWSTTTADLKYRLSSGVWGLDETLGLIGSYQNFKLGDETVPLVGAGAFWAKSMPRVLDRLLNLIPYMNYPKWVDAEFVIYPLSLNAENVPNIMWAINFHGKVLWSENFFGEAGFGMRNIDFVGGVSGLQFQFLTAYITLGLGVQF